MSGGTTVRPSRTRLAVVLVVALLAGLVLVRLVAGPGDVRVLAKTDGPPPPALADPARPTLEVAFDAETAARLWQEHVPVGLPREHGDPRRPGIYGELDQVDFGTHAVALWWGGESSGCPTWIGDVDTDDRGVVQLRATRDEPGCVDDLLGIQVVVAVARDRLPEPAQLPAELLETVRDGPPGQPRIADHYRPLS